MQHRSWAGIPNGLKGWALLTPILVLYFSIYLGGLVMVWLTSVTPSSSTGAPTTLQNYAEAFGAPLIGTILSRTVRISLETSLACLVLGFPVAHYLTSPDRRWKKLVFMCVVSPLMVSSIGRIFGWIALFGPGSFIANILVTGFNFKRTGLLYTEAGMVIGLTNLLLPFMVLSIAASRSHLDLNLLKAASSLGAKPFAVFRQIELPLSMPGILNGILIVFSLCVGNFVTAVLLGGSGRDVLAYEIYLDILVYFQQGRGTALAILLLISVIALLMLALRFGDRSARERVREG